MDKTPNDIITTKIGRLNQPIEKNWTRVKNKSKKLNHSANLKKEAKWMLAIPKANKDDSTEMSAYFKTINTKIKPDISSQWSIKFQNELTPALIPKNKISPG